MRRSIQLITATLLLVLALLPAGAAAQQVVLAFGDSITRGFGDGDVSCASGPSGGYPPRLRSRLVTAGLDTSFRNLGVCGELTSQGVTRIDRVLEDHDDAAAIIIMEGTNDLSSTSISVESMRFNIERMAEKSLEALVRPVVASPIPRAPEAGSNDRTAFLAALLAGDTGPADIDFSNQYDRLNGVPDLYDRFYADPLHPDGDGYDLVADGFVDPVLSALSRPVDLEPCAPDDQTLCLNRGRFQIEVEWEDFDGNTGTGQAVPLTSDTGYFWFFDPDNVELVLKVLDGQNFNERYWVFYGALSTVRYAITVTDTERGLRKVYLNPPDNLASVGDTDAFPGDAPEPGPEEATGAPVRSGFWVRLPSSPPAAAGDEAAASAKNDGECVADAQSLCLNESRFRVRSRWMDFDGNRGVGQAVDLTEDTGYFFFFDPANVELMVKVLDGRGFNDSYWVFFGALSNVEFEVEVTDTATGETVTYANPLGEFGSVADTEAFRQSEP